MKLDIEKRGGSDSNYTSGAKLESYGPYRRTESREQRSAPH
jgi:hypothetical protein